MRFFANYTLPVIGRYLFGQTTSGDVVQVDYGTTDDGEDIFYSLDTQEIDCNNRAHVKSIADELIVYTDNGQDSQLSASTDGKDFTPIKGNLGDRVNILEDVDLEFRFITFRWSGSCNGEAPVFEGIQVENVIDQGTQRNQD